MRATSQNLPEITHLTFDCYGTLIDWKTGILNVLSPLFQARGVTVIPETILRLYAAVEARLEAESWRPYRQVLAQTAAAIGAELGVALSEPECLQLPESVGNWLPFPDTVGALRELQHHFKLVILSNIDDDLFARTARLLQVRFDEVITAEQVHSYKPGEAHFKEALKRLQLPPAHILHVAQSLYHDHVTAKRLGFRTAWIRRPDSLPETCVQPRVQPDLEAPDLASLVDKLLPARGA